MKRGKDADRDREKRGAERDLHASFRGASTESLNIESQPNVAII